MVQQGSHLHTQLQGTQAGTCSVQQWQRQTTKSNRTEHSLSKMQLLGVSGLF